MEVYHASSVCVSRPDTAHSRQYLDFGVGFYVTTLREQAIKYGERFLRRGRPAVLNIYDWKQPLSLWNVLEFKVYDEAWLDFVMECRAGRMVGDYDVVIGGIANDKVFRSMDLYFAGDINKQECLRRLMYEKPNLQICIRNQLVIDDCITFKTSELL